MTGHVINAKTGKIFNIGQGLGKRYADKQGSYEPGPLCYRDRIELVKTCGSLIQGFIHNGMNGLNVSAGSQFRHNPSIRAVYMHL